MRPPQIRASFLRPDELVVDNFAGGGGASTGIEAAIGRPVDIAINHDRAAIAMHEANHPETRHFCEDIWSVDPVVACGSRPVGLAWFSPDCTHFSRAKGTAPVKKEIRGLADVVIRWAKAVRPRVIVLENVEEFQTWGPLNDQQRPDPARAGEDFRRWMGELSDTGYRIDRRSLIAADYGTPTIRKRLFVVARCDDGALVWPDATHGKARLAPWRPASEIIDWSLPCPSIFERPRPLAEATLRRIAAGVWRYVINAGAPFIVPATNRGELALMAPTLIQTGYGERPGQRPRSLDLGSPLGTVVAGGAKHALVAALLTKHYGGMVGHGIDRTIGTVTSRDHHALTTATLEALDAESAEAHFLTKFHGTSIGSAMNDPTPTVLAGGNHLGAVRAFLVKYYGGGDAPESQLQAPGDPLHTVTTRARFGLVTIHGQPYQIVDIGMRMLSPRELFDAMGFPHDYDITPEFRGKPLTKTAQIEKAGNAVCPQLAEAVVSANLRGSSQWAA